MTTSISPDTATRLYYHDGMFLTTQLMSTEQNYFVNQLALQNSYLYNPGYLDGLESTLQSNNVVVQTGAGFNANGNLLLLANSNNVVTLPDPDNFISPSTIYLIYPTGVPASPTADTVNMTATLSLESQPPQAGTAIPIAKVTLDGTTYSLEDARVKVTSKIAPKLNLDPGFIDALAEPGATSAKGAYALTYEQLPTQGQSRTFTVDYDSAKTPQFTASPQVVVSLQSDADDSIDLSATLSVAALSPGKSSFTLQITALKTVPENLTHLSANWLAFVN